MDTFESTTATDEDEQAIRKVVARAQESQSNPEALLALHTPEAVIVNLAGRRVLGREAFGEAMAAALASPLSDVLTTLEVVDVRLVTPDAAVVSCTKTVHDGRGDGDAQAVLPSQGALTYVMRKDDGSWRIALAQTTPTLAAPATGDE
ncbi:SgcJ/EcaC family oxidoreductase [Streptomonospora alba]|uniref:SgcJ/EcaC family oxidoreductase n=1 Tax=Streptomonospora alba TaxID=183763 RepID=UPI00069B62C2|nr:SgcJ/EcaC family oxidoreductase [Streptomonospora alba]